MNYNRSIMLHGTIADKAHEANKRRRAAKNVESNRYQAKRKDIELLAEMIHPAKSFVRNSQHVIVNPSANWNRVSVKGNETELNEKLARLNSLNFYDLIAGSSQTGEELIQQTLIFNSLNNPIKHSNQRGTANESLASWRQSYDFFTEVKNNKGSLFAWDLETTGGKDLNGIWRPESITEFAMQEANFATGKVSKTNVLVGMSSEEGKKVYDEIVQAIKMNSLDSDDRLKVTAMRLAKYGSDDFKMEKVVGKGYYQATGFPVKDTNDYKNTDLIAKGIERLVEAGKYSRDHSVNGVPADIAAIAKNMNEVMLRTSTGTASLLGQNDSVFDQLIINAMFGKWSKQYGSAFDSLFNNGIASFNVSSQASLDLLGGVKLFTEYNPIRDIYAGASMKDVKKVRGQEYIAQAHLQTLQKTLRPHMAEDDVTALLNLAISPSEAPNLKGKNISFLDYINEGISKVNYESHDLAVNKHVLRAKKRYGQDTATGKGFMHFARSQRHGTIITPDNRMIGVGDAALEASGGVLKEGFNLGFGINKGAFYDIKDIKEVTLGKEIREIIGEISPEYYGQKMYHVQLGMVVDNKYKGTRLGDLTQNFLFKSEKEMNAFLSGYFDVAAERTDDGIEIVRGMEKHFDKRELRSKKGKAILKEVNKNATSAEAFQNAVLASNEKLLVSRADNNMLGNNSYKKISKALNLKADLEGLLNTKISGSDITAIMSGRISQGQMALGLNNSNIAAAQDIITKALEYNAHNTKRLLDSSVDNMATGLTMISSYEKMLSTIIDTLQQTKSFTSQSDSAKQEIFSRVVKEVRRTTADHLYKKEGTSLRMQLGNSRLNYSYEEFKNMFEIDYSKIIKGNRVNFIDTANPSATANILKLDLSNSNSIYSLINTSVDAVYGSTRNYNEDIYKQNAITKMFAMLNSDTELGKTKAFKAVRNKYGFEGHSFTSKDFRQEDIAQSILEGMKQLKSKNATKGIINLNYAYMKSLEGHTAYSAALNSQPVLDLIPNIVKEVSNNFKYSELKSFESSKQLAEQLVTKYYMPNIKDVKAFHGNNSTIDILYKNTKADMTSYLADVIYSATGIEGAMLSVQDNGALVFSRNGRYESLENLIPKVRMNEETGILYTELGSMKLQLTNMLDFNSSGPAIKGTATSSLAELNSYSMYKGVQHTSRMKGAEEGVERFLASLRSNARNIRQMPTINGFGGKDIDSNFSVDTTNIKKVLVNLFEEGGSNSSVINSSQFIDKDLVQIMRTRLKQYIGTDKKIENLDAETIRDLSKNMQHILNAIIDYNGTGHSNDFKYLAKDLGIYTGLDKNKNTIIGVKGYRPSNSIFGVFDNTQRPTIIQAGNAHNLRVSDIEKANKYGVTAGNIISSAQIDKRSFRELSGIGSTTTDVMMNISYVDNTALRVLIDNNFNKVMNENNVELGTRQAKERAFNYVRNSVSTFEQERIMDSRVHEAVYGLKTANTQKLSKGYDLTSALKSLSGKDFDKQAAAMLDHRGVFTMVNGELQFDSSPGKLVRRGESVLKWKGFANIDSDFSSKMEHGVFNFNFYKGNGIKVRDSEINAILKSNQSRFLDSKGRPLTQGEMIANLENLLSEFGIKGQYAIEDISAIGYVKTMSSGAEKGMTDIVYASTGSYNDKVQKFFKSINRWDVVKGKVLTEEGVDAVIGSVNPKNISHVIKQLGLNGVADIKSLIAQERHTHSALLFDTILNGKANMLANDAVNKHGNIGQMYEGTIAKAIELLGKEYNDSNKAVTKVAEILNQNSFITNINLKAIKSDERIHSIIGAKNINGRLILNEEFRTDGDIVTTLDNKRFESFIKKINDNLTGEKIISSTHEGRSLYGPFISVDGKVLGTNRRENIKYVNDAETQTGVTAEYFQLKQESSALKREKIKLEAEKAKGYQIDEARLSKVKSRLREVDSDLVAYKGAVKEMKFGDQELSILERIVITDAHAEQIQDLIDNNKISHSALQSSGLSNYITVSDGKVTLSKDFAGQQALSKLTKQLRGQQYFDRYTDIELTSGDLLEHPYLRDMYIYAKEHNIKLGKEAALHQHKINLAQKASLFNDANPKMTKEELIKAGFEERNIKDVLFNADNIVEKNLLVDLGEEFGAERYIALPGTGMSVADEEIKTLAQKKLGRLQGLYDEYAYHAGNINDASDALMLRIKEQRGEVLNAIDFSIYGKHGLKHNASRIEIDAVAYRLKASGVVSDTATEDLMKIAKMKGIEIYDGDQGLTKKAHINGLPISMWEGQDKAYFDYKFVSREQMSNMGYFEDDTLKQFGFLNTKGTNRAEAILKMEDHLKTYGTFDITDRYPNIKNTSLGLTKVFLDDNLQGNQTKVSISMLLKANADHDGDSYSSFRAELLDGNKKVDGALYELAKLNGGRNSKYMSPEIYDEFSKMENVMTGLAFTDNRYWQEKGAKKILEDFAKNVDLSKSSNMVLVPGGESILGKIALANNNILPSLEEFNEIERGVNNILEIAKAKTGDKAFDVKIHEANNSPQLLDKALTAIKGSVPEDELIQMENLAIRRIGVDKYAQEMMAKTGLSATGAVNLSLNAVKLASHFASTDVNQLAFTNYVWDVLDTAEQGVISSKKMQGGTIYDDKKIQNFKTAMADIFSGKRTNAATSKELEGLKSWLDEHGDDIFEVSYKKMKNKILSPEQLSHLDTLNEADRLAKGTQYMKDSFFNIIKEMSGDTLTMSYWASVQSSGRNSIEQTKNYYLSGYLGAAASDGRSMASIEQGMSGFANRKQLEMAYAERADLRLKEASAQAAKDRLNTSSETAKANKQIMNEVVETLGNSKILTASGGGTGGLGVAMLGLAAGLMVGGYASGNPLNDKSAQQVNQESQPVQTMSIPDFMDNQGGYVTGNSQQGYIINIKADTKKGRKHMEKIMSKAAEATVGGAVSVNMNIKNVNNNGGITDKDIENFMNRFV